eukprot:7169600-Pyramimonas_sp.AAC.1
MRFKAIAKGVRLPWGRGSKWSRDPHDRQSEALPRVRAICRSFSHLQVFPHVSRGCHPPARGAGTRA